MEGGKLEGVLVGLGAAVAEEEAVVRISGNLAETGCEVFLQGVLDGVGVEAELAELGRKHLNVVRMTVTYRNHCVAAVEIGVLHALGIPESGVEAAYRLYVPEFICLEKFHF